MYTNSFYSSRFQQALRNNKYALLNQLSNIQVAQLNLQLFLQIFKAEQILETWIKNREDLHWKRFKSYTFCQTSGTLGPKRKEGDCQIPEGIYHIDRFNPNSKYHLSLGLNYPNASDRILGDAQAPGSDIFIHGGCETVGCIPITDIGIEELYVLATWAKENGQAEIPVHIFPFRFTLENWNKYIKAYPQNMDIWQQLKKINFAFEKEKELPKITIQLNGEYSISY